VRQQEAGVWADFDIEELGGKTVGIVGYGEIGRAVAERAKPFGCKIVALRRKPENSADDPLVDRAYAPSQINEMLAACDFVVAAAPLTLETRGLIGGAQIAVLKPSAVVINIGRGPVIDEPALVAALESGKIRGAALDVFTVEPLPAGHAFYKLQNVLLSPHSADHTPGWRDRAFQCFLDNFARFRKGEPLENVVDKHAGY
jgi:phosphoglycerate dehydrogenase-like enzyme